MGVVRTTTTLRRNAHPRSVRPIGALLVLVGAALALAGPALSGTAGGSLHQPVHLLEVTGEIDLGIAPFLDRALTEAEEVGAAAVVLRIDTPGGRLDAVLQMRDSLLRSPVRTIAFVDQTAFSAGALVALASREIHMTPAAVMGAATPVTGEGLPADEKVISAVRATFRATAEQRGRDPLVAEAMVDPDVRVDGLVEPGELVTLTTPEAAEWGYADGVSADLDALYEATGLGDRTIVTVEPGPAERLVRFITNPLLASLLMMIGVWLIVGDLLSGGVGIGVAVGGGLLAVFFWGHLLAGLAGWEDVALVVLGVLLLLVELVVIPGFGVAGVLGLIALAGGTFLTMLNRDLQFVSTERMLTTGAIVAATFLAVVAGTVALLAYLSRRRGPEGIVLRARLGTAGAPAPPTPTGWLRWFGSGGGVLESDRVAATTPDADTAGAAAVGAAGTDAAGTDATATDAAGSAAEAAEPHRPRGGGRSERPALTGATGVALSDLHPAGVAEIDGHRIDVITEGEYLSAGEPIEVLRDEGYRRVVRRRRR